MLPETLRCKSCNLDKKLDEFIVLAVNSHSRYVFEKCSICREFSYFLTSRKIEWYKRNDIKRGRWPPTISLLENTEYIDVKWVCIMISKSNGLCIYCGRKVLLSKYEPYDYRQFSVDRIDNSLPHIKSNCVISCFSCNTMRGTKDFDEFRSLLTPTTSSPSSSISVS